MRGDSTSLRAARMPGSSARRKRNPLPHCNAPLQQEGADLVDDAGAMSFHIVGHDKSGTIVLQQKWSRGQVAARLANLPPCLIGMEACVGAHHLSRKLQLLGLG
jgi:hypothetical protein